MMLLLSSNGARQLNFIAKPCRGRLTILCCLEIGPRHTWRESGEKNRSWHGLVRVVQSFIWSVLLYFCSNSRDGDHYDALRDCLQALALNPAHLKAHFRLARCLFELRYVAEALDCLEEFKAKFPEQAQSSACDALDRDIRVALFSKNENRKSPLYQYILSVIVFVLYL